MLVGIQEVPSLRQRHQEPANPELQTRRVLLLLAQQLVHRSTAGVLSAQRLCLQQHTTLQPSGFYTGGQKVGKFSAPL